MDMYTALEDSNKSWSCQHVDAWLWELTLAHVAVLASDRWPILGPKQLWVPGSVGYTV